jgi:DNA-binding response OmpR family regulator
MMSEQTIDHSAPAISGRDTALVILRQGADTREWGVRDAAVIGRDAECDICMPDRTVSRRHATIRRTSKGYIVLDEDSKNGTFVNGEPVEGSRALHDGDEISIAARYKLYFVDADATAPLLFEGRGLRIDRDAVQVYVNGVALDPPLSSPQFELLRLLVDADGAVVTRDDIIGQVWPDAVADGVSEDAVDALVRRLRARLAEVDAEHSFISTIRGYGFRLESA